MNDKRKKVYAIIIVVLFVLSIATSLLPSFEVKASQTYYLKDTTLWKYLPSGDELYNLQVYNEGILNSNLGDEILKGCNTSKLLDTEQTNNYITRYENFKNMLNDKTLSISGFIGGYSLEQITLDIDSYPSIQWFRDFLEDDTGYNVYLAINESDAGFQLDYYITTENLDNHGFSCNGGGYLYSLENTTVYYISINLLANNFYNNPNIQVNTFNINSDRVSPTGFQLYTDFPLYFTWAEGYGSTYQNLNSASAIRDMLSQGQTSDFLVDRRTLMSNYGGRLTVDTDPISQANVGVYDFDFYPSGDVTSGVLNIDNLQLSAKTSEMENVHLYALITYNFQCNGFYYEYGTNVGLVENYILNNMNTKPSRFNIRNVNILETTIDLDDTTYQTYSSRSIMKDTGPTDGEKYSIYIEDGIPRSIDMFDLYGISNYCQFVASTQTTPTTKVSNISSSVVTVFQVSCSIKIDYNDGQVSKTLATNTYDYFTGDNYKYGLTSTDNNTPADDMPSTVTDGLQWINNGGFGNGVGGNTVNGGSNSNSNTNSNNPSFTNNNNPTINIENNNTGGGFGTPETQNGMIEEIWSIWSSWQFLKDITQEVAENDFIQFVFSGDLYQLPLMNIVIPAVAVIVFISIASTVIRFIRGN